jgi:hypothetical protein
VYMCAAAWHAGWAALVVVSVCHCVIIGRAAMAALAWMAARMHSSCLVGQWPCYGRSVTDEAEAAEQGGRNRRRESSKRRVNKKWLDQGGSWGGRSLRCFCCLPLLTSAVRSLMRVGHLAKSRAGCCLAVWWPCFFPLLLFSLLRHHLILAMQQELAALGSVLLQVSERLGGGWAGTLLPQVQFFLTT